MLVHQNAVSYQVSPLVAPTPIFFTFHCMEMVTPIFNNNHNIDMYIKCKTSRITFTLEDTKFTILNHNTYECSKENGYFNCLQYTLYRTKLKQNVSKYSRIFCHYILDPMHAQ